MSASLEGTSCGADCRQDNVTFVLVRPNYLGNIGSAARAMKNFGFFHLALVQPPHNYKDAEARMMAVGAFDLLKSSMVHESLLAAVENSSLVFATTSGRQRAQNLIGLKEAAQEAAQLSQHNRVTFVFGDEKNGLGNEEMARCHRLVHIESNPVFSSLNLSHAVGIVAYELTRANQFGVVMRNTQPSYTRRQLPTVKDENEFFALSEKLLKSIEFLREFNREVVMNDLRRLYQRMSPTKRELDLARGALHKALQRLNASGAKALLQDGEQHNDGE